MNIMNNKKDKLMITGNVGEWSELYALLYILSKGGMYGADENQNLKKDLFYKVLKIIFEKEFGSKDFVYELHDNKVLLYQKNNLILELYVNEIKIATKVMYEKLISYNEGRAFSFKEGTSALKLIDKLKLKASSKTKHDIDLIIIDPKNGTIVPQRGFSIKSQLGGLATLVNASGSTNFVYELTDKRGYPVESIDGIELVEKEIKNNISKLILKGFSLKFKNIDSDVFEHNLSLIDSKLTEYLSQIVLAYYSNLGTNLDALLEVCFSNNIHAIHKLKEFLSSMALGIMPGTKWDGSFSALGGLILVKRDGEVICYYLYNLDEFRNFLLKNTKLDTPSTTRHKFGKVYQENGKWFIKLNLQVRFK